MIDELMELENNEKDFNKVVKKYNKQIEPMKTTKL